MSHSLDIPVHVRREELASPVVAALIRSLNAELSDRYPEAGAKHFGLDAEDVAEDRGTFLVARAGGRPVGCGALRRLDPATAEIKRMYVAPDARGADVGRVILEALLTEGRRLGVHRIVLETGRRQPDALSFYLKAGFARVPLYGECLGSSLSVCMARSLEPRPPERPLVTPRLVLSPLVVDDAERLLEYRSHPEVRRYQPFEPHSLDDARAFIAEGLNEPPFWRQFGIRLKESAELAGDIGFKLSPADPRQAEIGVTVAPDSQHRGYASEAVAGLLERLFDTLRLHRVFASIDPRNAASAGLFARLGFRQEGHFRQSLWFKDEWVDDVIFATLETEWENRQSSALQDGGTTCYPR